MVVEKRKSAPTGSVLSEQILNYGLDWVMSQYNLTIAQIQDRAYGVGSLPTPESNVAKVEQAYLKDIEPSKRVLSSYRNDHFVWDDPNSDHKKCRQAEENELYSWDSEMELSQFLCEYETIFRMQPKKVMKINKVTSLEKKDLIQDRFISLYLRGAEPSKYIAKYINHDFHRNSEKVNWETQENEHEKFHVDGLELIQKDQEKRQLIKETMERSRKASKEKTLIEQVTMFLYMGKQKSAERLMWYFAEEKGEEKARKLINQLSQEDELEQCFVNSGIEDSVTYAGAKGQTFNLSINRDCWGEFSNDILSD
ncbi:hypothetical protein [Draconibacterium sediminis]|uniref:Uncharacterized protein n=1 Tax=Draconibacterium sediminis TaxID=1544798 RepID=A0A0D8J982_9BACT|nr:hypothetical protein [Draconibacterium sediminis]KJF43091.1 hypothetical protein LH29_17075 [Draconibacterium sediminis]